MKRALLIAGGTVGSLGAVFAITPPTFTSTQSSLAIGGNQAAPTATQSAAPAATQSATASSTQKPSASSTKTSTTAPAATQSAAPATTQSAAVTSGKAQSGTFIGEPNTMRYGTVQVKITISGGKIVDVVAIQAPGGRDQRYTDMAVPVMRQKVLAAQSSNVTAVSGASYTSYAYWVSLQSALTKAGWL